MNTSKTPVTILQELAVSQKWPLPEYTVVDPKQGGHIHEFHYQVTVNGETAVGIGLSKKEAKQQAAKALLDKLPKTVDVIQPKKKIKLTNFISDLHLFCVKNKLPLPTFIQISESGPDHYKEFTYECKVVSVATRGTANSKKQAQQYAAKEMLERITNIVPNLISEFYNQNVVFPAIDKELKDECELKSKAEPDSSAKINEPAPEVVKVDSSAPTVVKDTNETTEVQLSELQSDLSPDGKEPLTNVQPANSCELSKSTSNSDIQKGENS